MINIYDYFYSKEVANQFKQSNHEFTPAEMVYIIYKSYKPLSFKIQGLNHIKGICNDKELIEDIDAILEEYEEDIETFEYGEEESYYKVELDREDAVENHTFKTFVEVKKFIDDERQRKNKKICNYKITKYEFCADESKHVEYNFVFNEDDEIISSMYENKRLGFPINAKIMQCLYVKTPQLYENNGMKLVKIYDPDFTKDEKVCFLSDNQSYLNKVRIVKKIKNVLNGNDHCNTKLIGPVGESFFVDEKGEVVKTYKFVNEFMNMYFVNEGQLEDDYQNKLEMLREKLRKNKNN